MITAVIGATFALSCGSGASAARPPRPSAPKPPVGRWTIEPGKGAITAGSLATHLRGKNLVATDLTFTLAAPRGYYREEVCPFSQETTMEAVSPLTVQWRQMNGRFYRNEVTFWSNDNARAEIREANGETFDAKVGIFFPGNWGANPLVKGEKKPAAGLQVEVAPNCIYTWTNLGPSR